MFRNRLLNACATPLLTLLEAVPTPEETQRLLDFVRQNADPGPRAAYSDILWAVLNSSEFAFNH